MSDATLEFWMTDPALNLTSRRKWLSSSEMESQLRRAGEILLDRLSSQPAPESLSIPTHFVRLERPTLPYRVLVGALLLVLIGDGLFRIWALLVVHPHGYWGRSSGLMVSFIAIQLFSTWLIYRALWRPIYRASKFALDRRLAFSAREAIVNDPRSPIVLLRSFASDQIRIPVGTFDKQRLEEIIAPDVDRLGPFIAIGRPKESAPHLGAARDYIADDQWQETVEKWMHAARVVAIVASGSPGLQWELGRLYTLGLSHKVILIAPLTGPIAGAKLKLVMEALWGRDIVEAANLPVAGNLVTYLSPDGKLRSIKHNFVAYGVDYRIAVTSALLAMVR